MKRYLTHKRKRLYSVLILIITFLVLIISDCIWKSAQPLICEIAEKESVTLVSNMIDGFGSELCYDELIEIKYDTGRKISSVTLDTKKVNEIKNTLSGSIADFLADCKLKVKVYTGDLTSSIFLLGKGIPLTVSLDSYSAFVGNIYSDIKSAGVNQSVYKVYADVEIEFYLILPRYKKIKVNITKNIPLSEILIVGDVPDCCR